jgi:hypothetical protein
MAVKDVKKALQLTVLASTFNGLLGGVKRKEETEKEERKGGGS